MFNRYTRVQPHYTQLHFSYKFISGPWWVAGGIISFSTLPKILRKHLQLICAACKASVLHKADQMKLFATQFTVRLLQQKESSLSCGNDTG